VHSFTSWLFLQHPVTDNSSKAVYQCRCFFAWWQTANPKHCASLKNCTMDKAKEKKTVS